MRYMSMYFRSLWVTFLFVILSSSVYANEVDNAKNWLSSEVNAGALIEEHNVSSNAIALSFQSAKETASAFSLLDDIVMLDRQMILNPFVETKDENTTEYISSYLTTYGLVGETTSNKVATLLSLQNEDGGFGHSKGYESNILDTTVALEALFIGSSHDSQIQKAIDYLLAKQAPDGSWQDNKGDKLYTSALALRALWLHRKLYTVQTQIDLAKSYLLAQKNTDGSYADETYLSALVLRSLAPLEYDKTNLQATIDYLKGIQQATGSWEEDVYTTALVLQALTLADKEVPNPDLASVEGMVVDGDTGIILSNIEVILEEDSNRTLTTSSDGKFFFDGLRNGTYTLHIIDSNYAPLHTTLNLSGGDIDLSTLRLNKNVNSTISTLTGIIKDKKTDLPIEGVVVRVGDTEAQTDSTGLYSISSIEAGTYMVSMTKSGYLQEDRSLNIPANTILRYNVTLRNFDFTVSANIIGTIIDGNNSLPLSDAVITLSDSNTTRNYTTTTTGSFEFKTLSQGTYHIKIEKDGYYVVQTTFSIGTSRTIDFGIIELHPIDTTTPQFASVQGVIVDAITKKPIENVLVEVSGLHTMTSPTGAYSIENIPAGEIILSVSKDTYKSVNATATLSLGSTLIFSPLLQKNDGILKLYGTILDSNSSEPLSDVNISIVDTNLTTFTDINGSYVIDNIPNGDITIEVSKFGYRTVKITTTVNGKNIIFSPTLQRNGSTNGTTTLHGRVVDAASDEVLANVSFYINGIDTGIRSDSDGNFTMVNIDNTDINLTLKKDDYRDVNSLIILSEHQELDIGTLHMRAIGIEDFKPDLVVEAINTSGIISNIHTLNVSGELNITIVNRGTILADPFEVIVFYDTNTDGNYTEGIDKSIANYSIVDAIDIGGSKTVSLELNTTADFRDQAIYVYVDSKNENVELDENNTYSTAKSCGGKQGKMDLGVCFDYSGSVSRYMHIQKNGLVQALRDSQKFPRDGSIRLMVLTGSGQGRVYLKPTIITKSNANSVADTLENTYFYGYDYMGNCLKTMANTWENMSESNQSSYRAVTLSGDGIWGPRYYNISSYVKDRDYAVEHGVNVVDAIGIGNTYKAGLEAFAYPQPAGGDFGKVYYATTSEDISNSLITTFQKQTQIADLTLGKLKIIDNGTDQNISIKFTVGNAGVATISSDINISVYEGDPANGGILLATTTLDENLSFGESRVIQMENIALQEGGEIYVMGDVDNRLVECTKDNNIISSIVSATSTLGEIEVQTDKLTYSANELVSLSATVTNPGKLSYALTAQLILEDSNGNIIQAFATQDLGILASNESSSISNEWNTTDTLAGTYRVRGLLIDSKGVLVDESNTTFEIVHKGMVATIDLMLDKAIYHTSDNIMMDNFIQSLSSNSMIENSVVVIEIIDSNQTIVYSQTLTLNTLLPLSQREADDSYAYSRLNVGDYTVKATLKGDNNTTFDTDTKTFKVQENLAMGLKGSVKLAWNTAHTGTTQTCNYSLTQFGSTYLDPQDYTLRIVDMSDGSIKKSYNNNVSLESLQTYNAKHNFSTHGFKKKLFSCGLYVRINDTWTLLDHKLFALKNITPIAQNDSIVTDENTKLVIDVLENDNDKEGALDSTTLTIVKSAKHGSVAVVNGKVQYTPQINYSGKDTFYYRVKDSEGLISNVARVDITINNSNEAPKAENQKLTTVINRHLDIMLTGNDPDGDALKYRIMSHPKHGTLSDMLPNVLYVPNIDYMGNDYFTFKVNDGAVDSNIAIVRIGIKKESASPSVGACTFGCGCVPTPLPSNLHAPTGLKVSSITGNSAVLSWNDNSNNELYFVVYINGKAVTVIDANTTSYTMENLDPETRYIVYIKVYGENGSLDSKKLLFKTGNFGWLPAIYNILNKAGE